MTIYGEECVSLDFQRSITGAGLWKYCSMIEAKDQNHWLHFSREHKQVHWWHKGWRAGSTNRVVYLAIYGRCGASRTIVLLIKSNIADIDWSHNGTCQGWFQINTITWDASQPLSDDPYLRDTSSSNNDRLNCVNSNANTYIYPRGCARPRLVTQPVAHRYVPVYDKHLKRESKPLRTHTCAAQNFYMLLA